MHHENGSKASGVSRRQFLQGAGGAAAGSVLINIPQIAHAQEADSPATPNGLKRYAASGAKVTLEVNGRPAQLTLTPDTTLLQALRESLNLTGAKEVCDRGACGACTVLVDGRSVNSCLMLAIDAVGHKITTVEGLADDARLDPLQQAFVDNDACQCGYCIPGFVVRARALLDETPNPDREAIKHGLCGNICRCAAYVRIFAAVEAARAKGGPPAAPTDPPGAASREENRVALENDAPRVDIAEKVTGAARYTTDYYLPKMLWAAYIMSDFGDARLKKSNLAAAQTVKGVLEVQIDKQAGRYHGDRLGHVCAESRPALEQALAALDLKFEARWPKTRLEDERTPLEKLTPAENDAAAQKTLDESEIVTEAEFQTQVQTHSSLEPHGCIVDFRGDSAVAYGSTQSNISFRDGIANELGLRPDQVEFHCEYVGGGFGSKFGSDSEGRLAAQMSKKYKRPCRVIRTRKEEHLDTGNRPGSIQHMRIGVARDGKIRGGKIATWGSVGPSGGGQASGGGGGGGGVRNPSRYDFGTVAKVHEDVSLNGGYPRAMRAPGHPQAMFAIELMMDHMAESVGMDPLQFRLINETSDVRREMLKAGAELIGWSRRKANGASPGPVKRGLGIGVADWGNAQGGATIVVNVFRNGTVEILSGAQDIGTGYRTMIADVVRTHLGLPRELVVVKVGRGDLPPGPASGGSVTSRFTAPKAFAAADKAKDAVRKLLAKEWKVDDASTIALEDGAFKDGDKSIDWKKACRLMTDDHLSLSANEDGSYWKTPTGSEAVQFADVSVYAETGIIRVNKLVALQNVGLPVNRLTIENQICGAVIQGLSFCLFEDRILNRQTGAMVNPNMDMYKIAGPVDVPEIVPVIWREQRDVGVNSLGEPPVVPTPGAIASAVANAIGAQVRSMPLTPDKVLAAIAGKERAG
jgi:xanthine dehydrogenase YagR molybdenum-binding subunit